MAVVYRITSDTLLNGVRTISAVKIDRDPRRRRPDKPIGQAVFWNIAQAATPTEIMAEARKMLDAR